MSAKQKLLVITIYTIIIIILITHLKIMIGN